MTMPDRDTPLDVAAWEMNRSAAARNLRRQLVSLTTMIKAALYRLDRGETPLMSDYLTMTAAMIEGARYATELHTLAENRPGGIAS